MIKKLITILSIIFVISCSKNSNDLKSRIESSKIIVLNTFEEHNIIFDSLEILEKGDTLINLLAQKIIGDNKLRYQSIENQKYKRLKSMEGENF